MRQQKQTKPKLSRLAQKELENKIVGKEPQFADNQDLTSLQLIHALNWYNYSLERADAVRFLKEFLDKRQPDISRKLEKTDTQYLLTSYCWTARLIDNGLRLSGDIENRIIDHAKAIVNRYYKQNGGTSSAIRNGGIKSDDTIAEFESLIDAGDVFSVYEYLTSKSISKATAQKIRDYYSPICEELQEVASTKDRQLKEGYRHLKAKDLKSLLSFYEAILADCDRYLDNKKLARKPRKKKTVPLAKKVAKVQFAEKFDEYQCVSVNPMLIIGAKEVWLYNIRYKTLTYLVSENGLDIKGTSVISYDEKASRKKTTGRSSKTVVATVIKGTKLQLRKLMDTIKGTESEPSGRINKDTLILRVT